MFDQLKVKTTLTGQASLTIGRMDILPNHSIQHDELYQKSLQMKTIQIIRTIKRNTRTLPSPVPKTMTN